MDLASVPEISPERFDVTDVAGFKAHLTEHGYAVVKCAVTSPPLLLLIFRSLSHIDQHDDRPL
jgi:hypothetical protein